MSRRTSAFLGRTLFGILLLASTVVAQEHSQPAIDPGENKSIEADGDTRRGLSQLHRDFGYPGAIRAWERGMYLNPRHSTRRYSYPSVYGSYYDQYAASYYRPYGITARHNRIYRESYSPNYTAYSLRLDHAYDLGVAPSEIQDQIAAQAEYAMTDYQGAMAAGYAAFRRGEYSQAARFFLFASQLNHGDPTSRLCAAHAQVALGQYASAAALLHRALDLQPKIAYLPLDIRAAYGQAGEFAAHLNDLRETAAESRDAKVWLLLGYYYYNSGSTDSAANALNRAHQLSPADRVLGRFADAVCGVAP